MLLQPRKYLFKTRQKNRTFRFFNKKSLKFGVLGLQLLRPLFLNSKQIFKLSILLKRSTKKSDMTKRLFWLNTFPHLPLTRKPKGMRMGKGTGKLHMWFSLLSAGLMFVEFKNLRFGRYLYFVKQLSQKLPVPTLFI